MARKASSKETYRTLFAKSGNQCAFPGCLHILVDEDDEFVAQICHIEAANKGGERYNENMSDEQRAAADNLIVLCYQHHKKTNNVDVYTKEALRDMKAKHEALWAGRDYVLSEYAIESIVKEEMIYWAEIDFINRDWVSEFDLARPVDVNGTPVEWILSISSSLDRTEELLNDLSVFNKGLRNQISMFLREIGYDPAKYDDVKYHENPFWNVEWERMNIGFNNQLGNMRVYLLMLKIHLMYQALKLEPSNKNLQDDLQSAKEEFRSVAGNAAVYD